MKRTYKLTASALSALLVCGAITPAMAASITKDDTVYATLDPDGNAVHQTVSSWLHSDKGLKNFGDVSNLEDIENIKGDDQPQRSGTALTWNIDGNDVYYQGTSKETLPIETAITYTLDGKTVTAEQLEGANGHLVIHIALKNNETKTITVDGKEYTVCMPYFTVIGTNLSTDHFQNVKAEDGTVQTDSSNQIVGFLAMPGMKDTYGDLLGEDLDAVTDMLLDEVTIECDLTDGELPSIYFACATNLNDLDAEDLDLDATFDDLDELKDATQQLIDGAKELADGCAVLDEKLGELSSSYVTFDAGIIDATSGAGMLNDGAKQLSSGMRTLQLGASSLSDGVGQLDAGAKTLADGAAQVNDGAGSLSNGLNALDNSSSQLSTGSKKLAEGLNQLGGALESEDVEQLMAAPSGINAGLNELQDGVAQLKAGLGSADFSDAVEGLDQIAAAANGLKSQLNVSASAQQLTSDQKAAIQGIEDGDAILAVYEQNAAIINGIGSQLGEARGALDGIASGANSIKAGLSGASGSLGSAASGLSDMSNGIDKLKAGTNSMDAGIKQLVNSLAGATKQLQEGAVSLDNGIAKYTAGVSSAASGAASLADGTGSLVAGAASLSDGISQMNGQVPELINGVNQLADGSDSLASGADDLSGGMQQLKSASNEVMSAIRQFDEAGTQLSDGSGELYDGIVKYNKEGISQITDNEQLTNLRTASKLLDEQHSMAKNAGCYSGEPESATETTAKFIMRTEEVQNVEEQEPVKEEVQEKTLWDRIKGLF